MQMTRRLPTRDPHRGLLTVNRVTSAAGSRKKGGGKGRTRVEKSTFVEAKTVATPGGPREVKLFAKGGQIGLSELTDTGEVTFTPLERIRTHRTQSQAGTYRWYNDYRLPADHGAGTITVRLHGNEKTGNEGSTGRRTSDRFHPATVTSSASTDDATTPGASTATSTTPCGCVAHTASATSVKP